MNNHEGLSIGFTTLACQEQTGSPLILLNYVNSDHRLALPYPDGDWYLMNTAVAAVRSGEKLLCSKLIDGLYEYYQYLGLIPEGADIIQVEPAIQEGEVRYGYPVTDPLTVVDKAQVSNGEEPLVSVTSFSGEGVTQQEKRLGLVSLNRPCSFITNHKAFFRQASSEFGYRMLPGECLRSGDDLEKAARLYTGLEYGVWLKFPTGSGGDLVYHVNRADHAQLLAGVSKIRANVLRALEQGRFSVNGDAFWPEEEFCPQDCSLVIEADVRNYGEVLVNGSTQFITGKAGFLSIVGHFQQLTTEEGEYLGNRPLKPGEAIEELLTEQTEKVASYSCNVNQYQGIQGVDWFLVRSSAGKVENYATELNTRPTANTPPVIIANKLGANYWINTNAYTDSDINNIEDYFAVIGKDLALGNIEDGLVIPQSFRTLVTSKAVFPSPNFKILILGSSKKHCNDIFDTLKTRGVRFSPTKNATD